ncbi:MAG: hypothetical protein ACTS4T_01640 [Candidatus Hodgkinia cicadicola]
MFVNERRFGGRRKCGGCNTIDGGFGRRVYTKSAFASRVGTLAGAFASASASLIDFRNVLRWPSRTAEEPAEVNDERVCCGRDLLIGLGGPAVGRPQGFKVNQMAVLANWRDLV